MSIGPRLLLSLLLPAVAVFQSDPHPSTDTVTVMGRVVDSNGRPVADAMVSAYPSNAELHRATRTASDGTFLFHVNPFGAGVITAQKPEDGYPNPAWSLYGRAGENMQPINATPAASPIQIELRFGERNAIIDWRVLSKADRSPVRFASYSVAWSDDPKIYFRSSTSDVGVLKVVLPKHPVTMTIDAPGFSEWSSAESKDFGGSVLFTPGTKDERTILLEPKGRSGAPR